MSVALMRKVGRLEMGRSDARKVEMAPALLLLDVSAAGERKRFALHACKPETSPRSTPVDRATDSQRFGTTRGSVMESEWMEMQIRGAARTIPPAGLNTPSSIGAESADLGRQRARGQWPRCDSRWWPTSKSHLAKCASHTAAVEGDATGVAEAAERSGGGRVGIAREAGTANRRRKNNTTSWSAQQESQQ